MNCFNKRVLVGLLAAVPLSLLVYSGCSRRPPAPVTDGTRPEHTANPLELLRKASTTGDYREVLGLLNEQVAQLKDTGLTAVQRELLEKRFHFNAADMQEIEAATFRPLDANYVETCFLFRDIARGLHLHGLPQLEQAKRCLAWVARQVQWQDRADDVLPPHAVLRLGRGSVRERALVFLSLLQQFQTDGCLVALPGKHADEPGQLVVGVLIQQEDGSDRIYLFDPRLGLPLPGPDGLATLDQLRKDPKLFWPGDAPAESKGDVEVFLAAPLPALAPRMKALEKVLVQDKVALGHRPEEWLARWEKAAGKVKIWNSPDKLAGPFRALAAYLPPEEHGLNKANRKKINEDLYGWLIAAWPEVELSYALMGLLSNEFPDVARAPLFKFTWDIFVRYVDEPRAMLLRGDFEQVKLRVAIPHTLLTLADPYTDLQKRVTEFFQRARAAAPKFESDKMAVGLLFNDPYLFALLGMRRDLNRAVNDGEHRGGGVEKLDLKEAKDVTFIILAAIKPTLTPELDFLQAQRWIEQAERAQAQFDSPGNKAGETKESVQVEWRNCADFLEKYVASHALTPRSIDPRIRKLRQQGEFAHFLRWSEYLFHDLYKGCTVRLALARARKKAGQDALAAKEYRELIADLRNLEQHAELKKCLDDDAAAAQHPLLEGRRRDLTAHGGLAWIRRAAMIAEKD